MDKTPILNELLSFNENNYTKFFMPSHLQLTYKDDFSVNQKKVFDFMKNFESEVFSFDVTEVNNFDNLSNPTGIIKQSQETVANSFGAKESFFLVNGSTTGVLAMISSIANNGDKILIQKNSHKSVYNACKINNLNPVFFESEKNESFDINKKIDISHFDEVLKNNADAKAVVITSSDYYGQSQDIRTLADIAHKYSMYLLVDAAHCAHYNYSDLFPHFPVSYADIAVTSFHKTLPCINQTAVLFTCQNTNEELSLILKEKINIFQTTSPSYILLSNIEIANYLMETYAKDLYDDLYENIRRFKNKLYRISRNYNLIKFLENDDFSRLVISLKNLDVGFAYNFLKSRGIFPEMMNEKSIVFICNIFHTKSDFEKLFFALKSLIKNKKLFNNKISDEDFENFSEKNSLNLKFAQQEKNFLALQYLKQNVGKKSSHNIFLYPPGTPFLLRGEMITEEILTQIERINDSKNIEIIF